LGNSRQKDEINSPITQDRMLSADTFACIVWQSNEEVEEFLPEQKNFTEKTQVQKLPDDT
jgi:hypothetical protein